jgi:hypothetical protein
MQSAFENYSFMILLTEQVCSSYVKEYDDVELNFLSAFRHP